MLVDKLFSCPCFFFISFTNVLFSYCEQATFSNRGKDGQGEEVIKPYTPTTLDSDVGHFELVIKVYTEMIGFIS
jgi:hypothetical protein